MCHCGRCAGCTLYKETVRRVAAQNRRNLLERKIPPTQMFADRYIPRYPGPAPVVSRPPARFPAPRGRGRVPNLFQNNAALRVRYPSPPRKPKKVVNAEDEYYARLARDEMAREAYIRNKKLAKMDGPKTPKKNKPVALNPSPVQQKKARAPRRDPLESSVNYDGKKAYRKSDSEKKPFGKLRDRK